jgi:SPP1 family predicted phage head-tail adaptor
MRAGQLRHRLRIEEPTEAQDAFGEAIPAPWSPVATVWGAVEPRTGREPFVGEGAQFLAEADTLIRIRYRAGITHKMRVVFGSRVFNILYVADVMTRRRENHLLCEELPDG